MRKIMMIAVLALAGCTAGELMPNVQPGMSQEQVTSILGRPDGQSVAGDLTELRYTNRLVSGWGWDRADYSVVLQDDRVVSYGATGVRSRESPFGTVTVLQPPWPGQLGSAGNPIVVKPAD